MTIKEGTLPVGPTDKLLDTTIVEQEDGTQVHREGVFIGDPGTAARRVNVLEIFPALGLMHTHAMATTDQALVITNELLAEMIGELRLMRSHLAEMTDEEIDNDSDS